MSSNPYESPHKSHTQETTHVVHSAGLEPWVGAIPGFFLGAILGVVAIFASGSVMEEFVVPKMVDPSAESMSYGQYFVLGIGPVAAIVGAVTGAVVGAAFCQRCRNRNVLLFATATCVAGFGLLWSIPLLDNPGQHIVVTNGAMASTTLACLIALLVTYLFEKEV